MLNTQDNLRFILKKNLESRKLKNPQYSLRAFSKDIGCSPASVSDFINGKRNLSKLMAQRILSNISHNKKETVQILSSFHGRDKVEKSVLKNKYHIDIKKYELISDWYNFAILELIEMKEPIQNIDYLSRRLNITKRQAKKSLKLLQDFNLIESRGDTFIKTNSAIRTSDNIKSQALRSAHKKTLSLVSNSLDEVAIDKRDITAMTFSIDSNKLDLAKDEIRLFYQRMEKLLTTKNSNEVYKLNVNFIPLTQEVSKNESSYI